MGNRLTQTGEEDLKYTYDALNRLTEIQKKDSQGVYKKAADYQYDSRGNQTRQQLYNASGSVEQATEYLFNLLDRMTETRVVESNILIDSLKQTHRYNASGQRIEKVEGLLGANNTMVNGQTTRYYYTGGVVLYTANSQHVLQSENILTPSGNTIASKRFSAEYANKWYFFQYDVRGSVTNIVDPNGNMVKGYNYDTFGKKTDRGNANFDNEVTYTSSVYDKASNLQYMNARFYDTDTGRFISQDSYAGNAAEPWTQHLYVYCGNNPVNYIDPTGHAADPLSDRIFWNLVKMQNNGSTLNQAQQNYVNNIGGQIKEQAAVNKPKSNGGGSSTPAPTPSPSPSPSPAPTPAPNKPIVVNNDHEEAVSNIQLVNGNIYNITTVIRPTGPKMLPGDDYNPMIIRKELTLTYRIEDGVFKFPTNTPEARSAYDYTYFSILAESMIKVGIAIDSNNMDHRTVVGVDRELYYHYIGANVLNASRARIADIGGYSRDHNAKLYEENDIFGILRDAIK